MSSTPKTLTGKIWHSHFARRSFHCQRALVEGGSFFRLCLRFWRIFRYGVLRLRRVGGILGVAFFPSLSPSLPPPPVFWFVWTAGGTTPAPPLGRPSTSTPPGGCAPPRA